MLIKFNLLYFNCRLVNIIDNPQKLSQTIDFKVQKYYESTIQMKMIS